jgi:type VI secretion system secreted protein VgrG
VGANQKVGVSTYMVEDMSGSHVQSVGGSRNLTIGGDHRQSVSANSELAVSGAHIDLIAGSVTDATLTSMTHTVGAAYVELTASDRSIAVEGARTETVGALKAVLCSGGRGTKSASLNHSIAGAMLVQAKANILENASGTFADVAGGLQMTKATNVTFAAKSLLTVICGGSTLTITPGSITLAGATIKLDGVAPETAVLVRDN